ncbi:MAG: FMN reductase [Terrimesophilobacter sp.]
MTKDDNATVKRIAIISAGLSKPSSTRLLADKIADAVTTRLAEQGFEVTADTFELRDTAVDTTNNILTGFPSPKLSVVLERVSTADGLIAVTPVFTSSYNGLFKSFFDVLDDQALVDMPVLIGATAGTPRHSLVLDYAMRPLFTYLHAIVVPTGVFAASSDWGAGEQDTSPLSYRIDRAAGEFAALVGTTQRTQELRDPFAFGSGFSPTGSYVID